MFAPQTSMAWGSRRQCRSGPSFTGPMRRPGHRRPTHPPDQTRKPVLLPEQMRGSNIEADCRRKCAAWAGQLSRFLAFLGVRASLASANNLCALSESVTHSRCGIAARPATVRWPAGDLWDLHSVPSGGGTGAGGRSNEFGNKRPKNTSGQCEHGNNQYPHSPTKRISPQRHTPSP